MTYITGDTHGKFDRIEEFCRSQNTTKEDILIILGDAGINYYGDSRDVKLKERLSRLPITFFCVHGNHENRASNIASYEYKTFHDGQVLRERKYPNLLFACDAEIYTLEGQICMVLGGAYSVDKHYRLNRGFNWWNDEQPNDETLAIARERVSIFAHKIDLLLTHTCPHKYIPTDMFLPQVDQSTVDDSTEKFLDEIEEGCNYKKWYCGHWHTDRTVDRVRFLFRDIIELEEDK